MSDPFHILRDGIVERRACVAIVGLGYVGLPLAQAFVEKGFPVLGFDVDPFKVECLSQGRSHIGHIPHGDVVEMRANGFQPTGEFERLAQADAILVCVPASLTPVGEPDLRYVRQAAESCAAHLRPGQLIVLESTTYPGTTRQVVLPILDQSGLLLGRDYFLGYSPERIDPGNSRYGFADIPKLVAGADPASLDVAATLYGQVVQRVVRVSRPEVAEAAKLLENTYRAVNIALVNELKVLYDRLGIDIWEVIDHAASKPFGFQPFYPGPGLGGHCLPTDPFYLTWLARQHGLASRLVELATEVNGAMPSYVVSKVSAALRERGKPIEGSRITLLGMAYKRDVDDVRASPGLELLHLLSRQGALVCYNDPHVPRLPAEHLSPLQAESQPLTAEHLAVQDCVVVVTDHSAYDWDWIVGHSPLVVDTRNATRAVRDHRERILLS